jgi:DNA-binding NarL/FixJ family response regulator
MKILIADDHALVRSGLTELLQSVSSTYEVSVASDVAGVLAYKKSNIDLLLLDLRMPGVETAEQVQHIHKAMPSTAIIMVSGNESPHIIHACMDAGAMGFVPKSSSNTNILQAIEVVLSGELYVPYSYLNKTNKLGIVMEKVTPRQEEIWKLLVDGLSNKAIARELSLTEGTVKQHVFTLYKNLNVNNRIEAVKKAKQMWDA